MTAFINQQSDRELAQRVQHCLQQKSTDFRKLAVLADQGTIRLSGAVSSYYLRQLANTMAQHVPGVLHVVDELHVAVAKPKLPKPLVKKEATKSCLN